MEKIVITGGLGNIGIHLAKKLVDEGHSVIIYDNREDRQKIFNDNPNVKIVNGNVLDFDHLRRVFIGATGIIHLAAVSRVVWGYDNPYECIEVNIMGTTNVLEAARISVRKPWIIFGSSREVYGEPDELPTKESAEKKLANVYGVTKLTGEYLLEKYCENYGLSGITLRFSNVYGSEYDQLDRVTPKFIIRASKNFPLFVQGGKQVFDFTHIDDTIQGIMKSIDYLVDKTLKDETNFYDDFHILTGEAIELMKLVEIIDDIFEDDVEVKFKPAREYDVEKFYGDPSKAEKLLGFKSKISLKEGIQRYAKVIEAYLGDENKLK